MYAKLLAAALVFATPLACVAATSVTIDANSNCLSSPFGPVTHGTPVKIQLAPGRYVFSLVSNSMSCSNGDLSGGCLADTVFLQGWGSARWGALVTANPSVVDVPQANMTLYAYIGDDGCSNNTGTAVILIQTAS
ncbi:hypothetical protein [Pseudomonas sp. 5P_5.1_Bac1]|uniref:hypothetical protein n=1 Tax=Pseudomonas sp. 5P_5.1_Bac1 TaxID=2971616 RepID=UPI0021C8A002|nr:hypothetical protein [Pseudomonas sp. 5P_5.1_Bac1]MCU1722453.1 hypothetical protein [Pseudomonas sp. 5P_5.1_Bac1]